MIRVVVLSAGNILVASTHVRVPDLGLHSPWSSGYYIGNEGKTSASYQVSQPPEETRVGPQLSAWTTYPELVWTDSTAKRETCRRGGQSMPTTVEGKSKPAIGEDSQRLPPGRTVSACRLGRESEPNKGQSVRHVSEATAGRSITAANRQ